MPLITFIEHDGTETSVHAEVGQSVMQAAVNAQVPGILADCGGNCSCATCHGYVQAPWLAKLPASDSGEHAMLDGSPHQRDNSRLTCQINVTPELDGMVIKLPESQY